MRTLSLKQKFRLLAGIFTVVLLVEIVSFISAGNAIRHNSDQLAQHEIPMLNKAHQLKLAVVQVQQWLTDISATRALDGLNDGFDEAEANARRVQQLISELQTLDAENSANYQAMLSTFAAYYAAGKQMAQAYIDGGPAAGNRMMAQFDETAAALAQQVDPFLTQAQEGAQRVLEQGKEHVETTRITMLVGSLMITGVVFFLLMTLKGIVDIIPRLCEMLSQIAHGDISMADIDIQRKDEIGSLATHINQMKGNIHDIVNNIQGSSSELQNSAAHLANITQGTQQGMMQQQSEISQIATAMNEMSSTSQEVAQSAAATAQAAREADEKAKEGSQMVNTTISIINKVASEVERGAQVIGELQQDSNNIGAILDVIRGIAEQTNLLALNAAIEAARAGEQGRGFAVVADEVRTLAQRTQQSTQEIQTMIERLQGTAQNAAQVMEQGRSKSQEGVTQISLTGEKLRAITASVATITDMSGHIASASQEQSAVVNEMDCNLTNINTASSNTTEGTEQLASASQQMAAIANQMQQMVTQFKL